MEYQEWNPESSWRRPLKDIENSGPINLKLQEKDWGWLLFWLRKYTVSQKKQDTKLFAITSLAIIRFSKLID